MHCCVCWSSIILFFSPLFLFHLIFNNLILLRGGVEVGVQPHSSHNIPFTFCGMVAPEEEPETVREFLLITLEAFRSSGLPFTPCLLSLLWLLYFILQVNRPTLWSLFLVLNFIHRFNMKVDLVKFWEIALFETLQTYHKYMKELKFTLNRFVCIN